MRCPVDGTTLALAERNGVEIDYCPPCRGVWLDRGELDRIIERAGGGYGRREETDSRSREHDDHDRDHRSGRRRGGPLSALGDLLGGGD